MYPVQQPNTFTIKYDGKHIVFGDVDESTGFDSYRNEEGEYIESRTVILEFDKTQTLIPDYEIRMTIMEEYRDIFGKTHTRKIAEQKVTNKVSEKDNNIEPTYEQMQIIELVTEGSRGRHLLKAAHRLYHECFVKNPSSCLLKYIPGVKSHIW